MAPCEWVIDILQEWVQAQSYLTTSYVNRGDPAGWDFEEEDLTADNAWHTLDLSAIVPANAKAVHLHVLIRFTLIHKQVNFRKAGNINAFNRTSVYTQVANITNAMDFVCPLDENRHIEYQLSAVAWTIVVICVRGWWL